jgi:predicted phage terminase large subunit-like protein
MMRDIVKMPGTVITHGKTFDNSANLPASILRFYRERYEGTRLGRQELFAEMLEEVEGALWTASAIDGHRKAAAPDMKRIVVAVDPSGTAGGGAGDDIGIIVAGLGVDGRFYVLADKSCNMAPAGWAHEVKQAYDDWQADRVVAEKNFGGAMVESVLRTAAGARDLPVKMVTASRGKVARAEPIAALYEQGKVSHVGKFDQLEDELCGMTPAGYFGPGRSPDRADALVWALTELCGRGYSYDLAGALCAPEEQATDWVALKRDRHLAEQTARPG